MPEKILVFGVTGLVGQTLLQVMEERKFPPFLSDADFFFFASEKSEGERIFFRGKGCEIRGMNKVLDLAENGLVFFCGEEEKALELVPKLKEKAIVIDNSPAFRLEPDVPLVVPEINSSMIKERKNLIANPNCTTIQLVLALFPLTKIYRLEKVILSSYQSVSGAGRDALTEFFYETEFLVMRQCLEKPEDSPFPRVIADNLIPQIGSFDEKGISREERKVREETKKILGLPELKISATCVRVPITVGHSISLYCEFQEEIKIEDVYSCLEKEDYLFLHRDGYPTPADVRNNDLVHIGRIRVDEDNPKGLHLWIVADNLRRGAATNAVLIAEEIIRENK